jgi:hypothetical protein
VRTDFEAIPKEDTDRNYVDRWLENQMKEYETRQGSVAARLMQVAFEKGLKFWIGNTAMTHEKKNENKP